MSRSINKGPFVDEKGKVVGEHKGIINYTVGQRDKLGIALGYPVYVYRINKTTNTVHVGNLNRLYSRGLVASQMNYVSWEGPYQNLAANVRIRYNSQDAAATVTSLENNFARIEFEKPLKSVTPGQSVVLYRGDVVLAGGIIEEALACAGEELGVGRVSSPAWKSQEN